MSDKNPVYCTSVSMYIQGEVYHVIEQYREDYKKRTGKKKSKTDAINELILKSKNCL